MFIFRIDGHDYPTLRVISLKNIIQVVDREGSGRTDADKAPMRRDALTTFENFKLEIAGIRENNFDDFLKLRELVRSFGVRESALLEIIRPEGILSQEVYIASMESDLKKIFKNGQTYWGRSSISAIAMEGLL